MVEQTIRDLVAQVPDLVAMIVIVLLFLRAQRERDRAWQRALRDLTAQISRLSSRIGAAGRRGAVGHGRQIRKQ